MYIYIYVCMYIHICIYVYIYICIYIYIYMCVYINLYEPIKRTSCADKTKVGEVGVKLAMHIAAASPSFLTVQVCVCVHVCACVNVCV